jgi:hypothetical protein
MDSEQQAFLADEIFSMTLMGTVQRGKLYRDSSTETQRDAFRRALRFALEGLVEQYMQGISDDEHLANIDKLAQMLSEAHPGALNNSRFRIGSAQKALNLYLKYMWCLGRIPTPPHCPFDSFVLSRVSGCQNVKWTQLDSLSEYERIVDCATSVAGDVSLAEWELHLYNALQPARPTGDIA